MIKAPVSLQDLRRRIYVKAKVDKTWRFWGLYVHVCKLETLQAAYELAKRNNGAPGIDGVTFEAIEQADRDAFLQGIRDDLVSGTYRPARNRTKAIPKGNGKVRILGIPTIRDRVVQGALKLILEPIFEADFQDGSYGYRPKRTAQQAVGRVAEAVVRRKTRVIDLDLKSYFDNVRHDQLLRKVAERVKDGEVLRLVKLILQVTGKRGVPQGGVISPLFSNLYLNEVDKMLERAKEVTRRGRYTYLEYCRYADDLVVLVDSYRRWDWLLRAAYQRVLEELGKLGVQVNEEKTRIVDLCGDASFDFLGFTVRRIKTRRGKWGVSITPKKAARTELLHKLKDIFRRFQSQPIDRVVDLINPILRGWHNYFKRSNGQRTFRDLDRFIVNRLRIFVKRKYSDESRGSRRLAGDRVDRLGLYRLSKSRMSFGR